ncbi:MAG: hypothetical protein JXJ17_02535 [Anaerolineae bacterium]|nr:hypothetical protein [Anaerolineae bacterium]
MDYGHLLSKAWNLVWNNKWLFLLGLLATLTSASGNSGGSSNWNVPSGDTTYEYEGEPTFPEGEFDPEAIFGEDAEFIMPFLALGTGIMVAIIVVAVLVGIGIWGISTIAHGGLIAGVNTLAGGGTSSFAEAWSAAWKKGWRLIGIALIPAIPMIVMLAIIVFLAFGAITSATTLTDPDSIANVAAGLGATGIIAFCLMAIFAAALGLWHHFARRACMIEDTTVFESYRRGWEVITANLGSVIALFLIVIAIQFGLGIVLFVPRLIIGVCLCCLAWPISIAISAGFTTYFSAVWTLAWRAFTGLSGKSGEPLIDAAPAE